MNAATHLLSRGEWNIHNVVTTVKTGQFVLLGFLTFFMIASAIGIIYVKDLNRRLVSERQITARSYDDLQNQHSQLLLMEGAWSTQTRIQKIAEEKIGMQIPGRNEITSEVL